MVDEIVVLTHPDPLLREVQVFDPDANLEFIIEVLYQGATEEEIRLQAKYGDGISIVGLAANQIGIRNRVLLFRNSEGILRPLVDPSIIEWSEETSVEEEGCASLPGFSRNIERPVEITVRHRLGNKYVTQRFKGFPARVIQHEVDHLDGILLLDYEDADEQ